MRVLNSMFILVFALASVSVPARAAQFCDEHGVCVTDPSLTSDDYTPPQPHYGSARSTAADVAAGTSGYNALVTTAAASMDDGAQCSSPYPDLPFTAQQIATCQTLVKNERARLDQKAKEDAQKKADEKKQEQPQQPPGGGDKGKGDDKKDDKDQADKGGDDKGGGGGSQCEQSVKQEIDQCKSAKKGLDSNSCSMTNNGKVQEAQGIFGGTQMGNANNSAVQMGAACGNGQNLMNGAGEDCAGAQKTCEDKCGQALKAIDQKCKEPSEKKQAKQKVQKMKQACKEKGDQFVADTDQNAQAMGQCKDEAAKNGSKNGSGGGMGDMMKAISDMMKKQKEDNPEDAKSNATIDVCTVAGASAALPQLCVCAKQNLSSVQCQSASGMSVSPGGVGGVGNLRDDSVLRVPADSGTALPAGYGSEISPP